MTGATEDVHMAWMRCNADLSLVIGSEVGDVFEMTKNEGE